MANKVVHVFENDGEYRVHPPTLNLDVLAADSLTIKNNTGEDIVVCFPAKTCITVPPVTVPPTPPSGGNDPFALLVEKNKKITVNAFTQGAGNSNALPYQVIAPKSFKKAKGNSDPVLIIEN